MHRYLLGGLRAGNGGAARWLAATVLLSGATSALALGLGEIDLDSALNEKLDAEIELYDAQGLDDSEILVSLASSEDFQRVGVERFFYLTNLRFEVTGEGGGRHVEVTSTQPITEPYLNFLVEVLWPGGRMLREYTVLLDPPTFSPASAPAVTAPAQSASSDGGAGQVERRQPATASQPTRVQMPSGPQRAQASPLDEGVVDGELRMTDRNDTLWSIAARTRPSQRVNVQQNMLAIQRLNPDAFLNGNINLLKAGYRLRLPSEQEALELSSGAASRQVAMQNEDWRALQRGEPVGEREQRTAAAADSAGPDLQGRLDATPADPSSAVAAAGSDGELRIVAGAGDEAAGSAEGDGEALNAALEEQDRLDREVAELTEALDREQEIASNQIAVKDRQLEVKDEQIAALQAQVEQLREEMDQAQAALAAQNQNQSASAPEQPWWQSTYALVLGVGAVVLLLVLAMIAARRRRSEADEFEPEAMAAPMPAAATARAEAPVPAAGAAVLDIDDGQDETAVSEPAPAAAARPEAAEPAESETSDVIGEADIYIAYGRYPQAIGLLLGVLEEDPDRNDVRLKLLELYAETRDRESFDAHLAELVSRCDDEEALLTARELGQQFGDAAGAGTTGAPADPGFASDLSDDGAATADTPLATAQLAGKGTGTAGADNGADHGLDLDVPHEGDLDVPTEPLTGDTDRPETAPGAEEFELELDDLGDLPEAEPAETSRGASNGELGGDLGLEFDPAPRAGAQASADDLDLDLDFDLGEGDGLGDDAFDFEDEGDTASTKLDLARAYIDMGDHDGARDILNEVVSEGNDEQRQRAETMLEEV